MDSAQRVWWQEAGVGEAPEKQVGEAATCPGSGDCLYHRLPAPAPGTLTYPCDNLMSCGSTVGRQLEGRQFRNVQVPAQSCAELWLGRPGAQGGRSWPAPGCREADPSRSPPREQVGPGG